jgi:hypothetical protein
MAKKAKSESGHRVGWSRLRRDELPDRDQQSRRLSTKPTRPTGILRIGERGGWVLLGVAAILVVVVVTAFALVSTRDPGAGTGTAAGTSETDPSATPFAQSAPATDTSGTPGTPGATTRPPAVAGRTQPARLLEPASSCGYPDATNTGVPAGVALTVVNGGVTLTTLAKCWRAGHPRLRPVKAPNVTIRRSKVTCMDGYGIASFPEEYSGGGLLIEDVDVTCPNGPATAIGYYGLVARRVNLHNCENGFDVDDKVTVVDSYIHDMRPTDTGHTDGIQLAGGSDIAIRHNTIFNPGGTSAIISNPNQNSNVTIEGICSAWAYTLYCPRDSSTNFRVIDNRFSTLFGPKSGEYGPWEQCEKVAENRGNVWDSTLAPVT